MQVVVKCKVFEKLFTNEVASLIKQVQTWVINGIFQKKKRNNFLCLIVALKFALTLKTIVLVIVPK